MKLFGVYILLIMVWCLGSYLGYSQVREYWPTKSWQYKNPSELFIDSLKLIDLHNSISNNYTYINSYIISRNGYIVYERYYNGTTKSGSKVVCSVTKGLINAIFGILINDGYVNSIDDTVINYIPDYAEVNTDERLKRLTFRHLCAFTTGIDVSESDYSWYSGDIIGKYLAYSFGSEPGTTFKYATPATHIISKITTDLTGINASAFASEKFLDAIGFSNFNWTNDSYGNSRGGWESYMRGVDMHRFGFLYLNRGIWDGDTLINPEWIDSSTVKRNNGGSPHGEAYGYNWWITDCGGYPAYFAGGYGGQFIYVISELDIVVTISSTTNGHHEAPRYLIESHVLPALTDIPQNTGIKPNLSTHEKELVVIYPNPAKTELFYKSEYIIEEVKVYSLEGCLLKTLKSPESPLDINLPARSYIIQFCAGNKMLNCKVAIIP